MTASAVSIPQKKPFPALFAPGVDMLVAGGGLSVLLLLYLFVNNYSSSPIWITSLVFWGGIVVNNPHYAATYYRVYRSSSEIKKYAGAAIVAPLALLGLGVACFASPLVFAPWFCKAYIVSSGFHYSGQSYGISLIYARKFGVNITSLQKWCIGLPIFMAYLHGLFLGEIDGHSIKTFFGVVIPPLGVNDFAMLPILLVLIVGVEAYIALNVYLWWKQKKRLPFIVHLVVVSHCTWFLVWAYQPYTEMVPFFHCFQYLLITSYFYMQELVKKGVYKGEAGVSYLKSHQFLKYYVLLVAIGYALFFIVPPVLTLAGFCKFALANAVVFSFINLHHFVLDGAVWKLRKPDVGKALLS